MTRFNLLSLRMASIEGHNVLVGHFGGIFFIAGLSGLTFVGNLFIELFEGGDVWTLEHMTILLSTAARLPIMCTAAYDHHEWPSKQI